MGYYNLFKRSSNRKPFLLLYNHHSCFEVLFLEYITNVDHPWMSFIGVSYVTSLWQVADLKDQNGSFTIAISKAKMNLIKKRLNLCMYSPGICATSIMIIVNDA